MIAADVRKNRDWTEAELQALPYPGCNFELVDGELVMSPKNNFEHELVCSRLFLELANFNRSHRLGVVLGSSLGCWMHNRNCRAPDISFITRDRLQALGMKGSTRKFLPAAPDLAVEILSPSNIRADLDERLRDFFSSGTQLAWIIDPEQQRVEVCRSPDRRRVVVAGGFLDGEHLLPSFRYPIADLFRDWDWD